MNRITCIHPNACAFIFIWKIYLHKILVWRNLKTSSIKGILQYHVRFLEKTHKTMAIFWQEKDQIKSKIIALSFNF